MRVGAALSTLVILGVSGLAYLLVADVYDMYPQLAYRAIFSVLGVLIPLPLAFFFGLVTVRHTLSLHRLMANAARCMWGFFGLFLLTWLLEGLLIGEAPGPFMYMCIGTLILSATIAHLLTLGARGKPGPHSCPHLATPQPSPASRQSAQACASRTSSWSSILPGHKRPGLLRTTLSKQTIRKTQTPPLASPITRLLASSHGTHVYQHASGGRASDPVCAC